jgi:hypothetical protein
MGILGVGGWPKFSESCLCTLRHRPISLQQSFAKPKPRDPPRFSGRSGHSDPAHMGGRPCPASSYGRCKLRPLPRLIDTADGAIRWEDYRDDTERRLTELVNKIGNFQNHTVSSPVGQQNRDFPKSCCLRDLSVGQQLLDFLKSRSESPLTSRCCWLPKNDG